MFIDAQKACNGAYKLLTTLDSLEKAAVRSKPYRAVLTLKKYLRNCGIGIQ